MAARSPGGRGRRTTCDASINRVRGVGCEQRSNQGFREAAGKVQDKFGKVVGSTEQRAKGLAKEVEGKAQKTYGDARDAAKHNADKR